MIPDYLGQQWYNNTHDYSSSTEQDMNQHDSITLVIDGDHGGGLGCGSDCSWEEGTEIRGPNQRYDAIARTASGPTLDDRWRRTLAEELAWTALPPYGDGGGGVEGEEPFISIIELYVTPFDRLVYDDIEGSVVSDLTSGKVIGFGIVVHDNDEPDEGGTWVPEAMIPGAPPALIRVFQVRADSFLDGLLLPGETTGADSAVSPASWARIKASLVE